MLLSVIIYMIMITEVYRSVTALAEVVRDSLVVLFVPLSAIFYNCFLDDEVG